MPNMPKAQRPKWMPERKAHEGRIKTNREVYGTNRWTMLARLHKSHNPICVACEAQGMVSPAEVTDHTLPINKGGAPWDWVNLQSLCRRCHDDKSAREAHDNKQKI